MESFLRLVSQEHRAHFLCMPRWELRPLCPPSIILPDCLCTQEVGHPIRLVLRLTWRLKPLGLSPPSWSRWSRWSRWSTWTAATAATAATLTLALGPWAHHGNTSRCGRQLMELPTALLTSTATFPGTSSTHGRGIGSGSLWWLRGDLMPGCIRSSLGDHVLFQLLICREWHVSVPSQFSIYALSWHLSFFGPTGEATPSQQQVCGDQCSEHQYHCNPEPGVGKNATTLTWREAAKRRSSQLFHLDHWSCKPLGIKIIQNLYLSNFHDAVENKNKRSWSLMRKTSK